jgi:hypothetical protein
LSKQMEDEVKALQAAQTIKAVQQQQHQQENTDEDDELVITDDEPDIMYIADESIPSGASPEMPAQVMDEDIPSIVPSVEQIPMVVERENLVETPVPRDEYDGYDTYEDNLGYCALEAARTIESHARKFAHNIGQRLSTASESLVNAVEWNAEHMFDEASTYAEATWTHTNAKIRQTATEGLQTASKWTKSSLQIAKKGLSIAHEKLVESTPNGKVATMSKEGKDVSSRFDWKGAATIAGGVVFVSLATLASAIMDPDDSDSD